MLSGKPNQERKKKWKETKNWNRSDSFYYTHKQNSRIALFFEVQIANTKKGMEKQSKIPAI